MFWLKPFCLHLHLIPRIMFLPILLYKFLNLSYEFHTIPFFIHKKSRLAAEDLSIFKRHLSASKRHPAPHLSLGPKWIPHPNFKPNQG